jgi:hypothetical protein
MAFALAAASLVGAETIEVDVNGCAGEVRVAARERSPSEVLSVLAGALGFELRYDAPDDPMVSIDLSRPPADIVHRLASGKNVLITEVRDRRCPGRNRIARVWVLPAGAANAPASPRPQPQADPPSAARRGHGSARE